MASIYSGECSTDFDTMCVADRPSPWVPTRTEMYLAMIEHFATFHSRYRWDAVSVDSAVEADLGLDDDVERLRIECPYSFIQQCDIVDDRTERTYLFKMSEDGSGCGVDLVRRMQPGGDLTSCWIMFDHIKRVVGWTTMSCHVFDAEFGRLMTIATCEISNNDAESQKHMWVALNKVMERNGVPNPYFKGFIANRDEANWEAVRVIYGNGDPNCKLVGRERCLDMDWTGSLERLTLENIQPNSQELHKKLCKDYKEAKTAWESEELYHCIRDMWLSSGAAIEDGVRQLDDWLGFWHFRYRQWGGFFDLVISQIDAVKIYC